jgi:hypothetical protein
MRIGLSRDEFLWFDWQYTYGVLAGLGVGTVFGSYVSLGWHPAVVIPGFALTAIASWLGRARARKR